MPQIRVTVRQQPFESFKRESSSDFDVFVDVAVVVEIDEVVTKCLREDEPNQNGETNANCERDSTIVSPVLQLRSCWHHQIGGAANRQRARRNRKAVPRQPMP